MSQVKDKLPSHPDSLVEDRLSLCEDYSDQLEVPQWLFIERLLQLPVRNVEDLLEIISHHRYDLDAHTLQSVFKLPAVDDHEFFSHTFPAMAKVALRMPVLFPSGALEVLTPAGVTHSVTLTREQIACLLVHMFLCTLQPPSWNKHWCTFQIWFGSDSRPATEYLQCLLTYFSQLEATGKPGNPHEEVLFKRCVLTSSPDWSLSTSCFSADIMTPSYSLQPEPGCNVEVSFANKDIGFGVSGTQEEVKMGMSPEACVVMLLAPTLQDNETLLIQGARQVGAYEGIGREVRFVGPYKGICQKRCILAMDAMELDCTEVKDDVTIDLRESVILRELNKAFCGFISLGKDRVAIATGHWGCGAFGGNKYIKALIQLMAASEANKRLVFHDITPKSHTDLETTFMQEFLGMVSMLSEKVITVGQLFLALKQLKNINNVFGDLETLICA